MAALLGIAVRRASRAPMEALEEAEISLEQGVAEDFRGGVENRQVTILVKEDWEKACSDLKESTGGLIPYIGCIVGNPPVRHCRAPEWTSNSQD